MTTSSLPVLDPFAPEYVANPEPVLAAYQANDPVWWWEEMRAWLVSGHREVWEALRDEALTMNHRDWVHYAEYAGASDDQHHFAKRLDEKSLITAAKPDHTRMRRVLSRAFSPRGVERQRAQVLEIVQQHVAAMAAEEEVDLVPAFSAEVPTLVISRMLGVPVEQHGDFRRFAAIVVRLFSPLVTDDEKAEAERELPEFERMVQDLVALKRREPQEDGLTDLIHAQQDEGRIDVEELFGLVSTLLVAGSETVGNQISFGILDLIENPDQMALIRSRPDLWPNAVLELLRHRMMGNWTVRFAKEPTLIGEKKIDVGQMLLVSIPAANRDPGIFPDPARLDLTRDTSKTIIFGQGMHFCAGQALAKVQLQTALSHLVDAFANMRLAGPVGYDSNFITRRITTLPLALR